MREGGRKGGEVYGQGSNYNPSIFTGVIELWVS